MPHAADILETLEILDGDVGLECLHFNVLETFALSLGFRPTGGKAALAQALRTAYTRGQRS